MDENTLRLIVRDELERALSGSAFADPVEIETSRFRFLTVEEAATIAHLHRQTLADALRDQTLHGTQRVRKGKWTVRRDCLEAWMEKRACEHQAKPTR